MDDKTLRQIKGYLEELDESKGYPADFNVLVSEINKLINIDGVCQFVTEGLAKQYV